MALAHNYPDPGGHKWQLIKEEKVRYFMPADQTTGPTTKQKIKSKTVSTSIEKQNEKQTEEADAGAAKKHKEKRDGDTWTENKAEGRFVTSYEKHEIDTYLITKTPIYDVKRWEERVKSLVENTYKVTKRLAWIDPINGTQKDASVVTTEGPTPEVEFGPWAPKQQATFLRTDTKEEVVETKVNTKKLGSMVAAEQSFDSNAQTNSTAFAGDKGRGAGSARSVSASQTQQLAGAGKARSTGTLLAAGTPLAALVLAARKGAQVHDAQGPSWFLTAAGTNLLFYPYDSNGKARNDAISVPIDKLKAAGRAGQIFIDNIDADGGLKLTGTFKNKYQGGRTSDKLIVK